MGADRRIGEDPLLCEVLDKHHKDMEKKSTTDSEPKGVFMGHDAPETAKDRIIEAIEGQVNKGVEKYGHSVDKANLSFQEWAEHFRQEMIDGLFYLDQMEQKIKGL